LRSAIKAGQKPQDIFVVDDASTDKTSRLAKNIVGKDNVIKVEHSGKGLALTRASKHFNLTKRYEWIHIADADGGFAPDYFQIFRDTLDPRYAAATGYIRSLPGYNISQYRVFEYTLGLDIHRRLQSIIHTVSVIPGPSSCFRSDVFEKVNFANHSLTEDFDVTIQLHRQKLGHVQYITKAVAYTQDPQNLKDFVKQISRWQRGIGQGIRTHKIGLRMQRIDFYLMFQVFQNLLFLTSYLVIVPLLTWKLHSLMVPVATFMFDAALTFLLTFLVALRARRLDIVSAFPLIYALRWVVMWVFVKSMFEVFVLGRYKVTQGTWSTSGRRYKNQVNL